MPSRIQIGPDGGPYVIVEEDNGDVNISSPNGNVDFQTDDISNVGALTADSVSTGDATITDATVSNFTDSPTGTYGKTIAAPTPTAYFSGPAHGEAGNAFFGATLSPDGRVIFAPFGSSNVGIFDPATDAYTSGPAHGEGAARSKARRYRLTAASSSRRATVRTWGSSHNCWILRPQTPPTDNL
ncbi:hypothetical protein OSG_eHP20_00220 [environmental Halophage eHP-20]|nr:hypothetical protein OSG_eHP20_00220 [environmental Halophage eHP-20]